MMDSEEETLYDDVDSGNESSGDDVDFAMEVESNNTREKQTEFDDYPYEVLSTEEIVQHMVDCIKEVNAVFAEVNPTNPYLPLREVSFYQKIKAPFFVLSFDCWFKNKLVHS